MQILRGFTAASTSTEAGPYRANLPGLLVRRHAHPRRALLTALGTGGTRSVSASNPSRPPSNPQRDHSLPVPLERVPWGSEGPCAWLLDAEWSWGYPLHQNPALWRLEHRQLLTRESGNTVARFFSLIRITAASKYSRTGG